MFDNNNDEDDFDFDLDEVVNIKSLSHGGSTSCFNNLNSSLNVSKKSEEQSKSVCETSQTQFSSQGFDDEWGNEDDSDLLDLVDPEIENNHLNTFNNGETSKLNDTEYSSQLNKSDESFKETLCKIPSKFPGPAGLILPPAKNNLIGQIKSNPLLNLDGLQNWDKALSVMDIKSVWRSKKVNLQTAKKGFSPGAIYLTAPLLILGVQRVDCGPVIKQDADCVLQDPTADIKGRILKEVISEHNKAIQVGSVLVLRRPSILKLSFNYLVNVTTTCLIGIYSPHTNQMTYVRRFDKQNLISWLSEPIEGGESLLQAEEEKDEESTIRLGNMFTMVGAAPPVRPSASFNTRPTTPQQQHRQPYNNYRGLDRPPQPAMNSNRPIRPAMNQMQPPRPAMNQVQPPRPSIRASYPTAGPTVRASTSSNQFQFKSPSAIVTAPRPAPYPQMNRPSNMAVRSPAPSVSSSAATAPSVADKRSEPEVDDQYISKFLEGVDTDALFDDF